jgi:single-strand DNA-binding protein
MASLNKVLLIGNLTRDPELRYIPSGSAVTSFTLAVNRVYKLQTGEKKEEVTFIRVVVWAKMAEVCAEYLKKGSPVFVEGRLQSRSWDGPDGQKRNTTEVVASNVQFMRAAGTQGRETPMSQEIPGAVKEEIPEIQLEDSPESGVKSHNEGEVPF